MSLPCFAFTFALQACRRAGLAEQNTIESEARCVNALTRALAAEKALAEARATVSELRGVLGAREAAVSSAQTELAVMTDAAELLKRKLHKESEHHTELQAQHTAAVSEGDRLRSLLLEAQGREKTVQREAAAEIERLRVLVDFHVQETAEHEKAMRSSTSEQLTVTVRLQAQCKSLQEELVAALAKGAAEATERAIERSSFQQQTDRRVQEAQSERDRADDVCSELRVKLARAEESARTAELAWHKKCVAAQQLVEATKADMLSELELQASALRDKLLQQEHQFTAKLESQESQTALELQATKVSYDDALLAKDKAHSEATVSLQQHYKLLLDEMSAERECVEAQLDAAQAESDALREALSTALSAKAALEVRVAGKDDELTALQQEVIAVKDQLQLLRTELVAQADTHSIASRLQADQLTSARAQLRAAEDDLLGLRSTVTEQEVALRELSLSDTQLEVELQQVGYSVNVVVRTVSLTAPFFKIDARRGRPPRSSAGDKGRSADHTPLADCVA
jgi:chromosome segregation ATPase